jgi:hypothetical protein
MSVSASGVRADVAAEGGIGRKPISAMYPTILAGREQLANQMSATGASHFLVMYTRNLI